MADSKMPGPSSASAGGSALTAAQTPGPLGLNDHGDPNVTTLLGDTPGPLGRNDAGDVTLGKSTLGAAIGTAASTAAGTPIAIGADRAAPAFKDPKVWATWTPPADVASLYDLLKENEGNIPHLYLDSKSLVTIGIGTYLPTAEDAKALVFYNRKTFVKASGQEIQAAYDAVVAAAPDKKKYPRGKKASAYQDVTDLEMTPTDIGERWLADVKIFQKQLPAHFKGFNAYPADARQALTDIAYQYGASGASKTAAAGKIKAAAEKGDWSAAADCTDDLEGSDHRNAARKALFLSAAKAAPLKAAPAASPASAAKK
ncbi:MAG: hypothetical protein ABW032_10280 [Burkholderiaceae bacterium]